ncbi:hypothetical protein, variant [Aphanomyces invadans]|uniref:Phospholipid/glycerol acyltransferase domain-containing protein n=1 Tax=Aphanomyces invadans TaxID=157072 RepID=A0A024TS92_9STRA|nr:hypothetical protein, variant [Aphanomyces invadans]ETV96878.1 hypothetical protein, variant [Aphanomyces invadans]|eukprot:XP_008874654.1 hypothetical protein, variant [Aphanomyces invadans]
MATPKLLLPLVALWLLGNMVFFYCYEVVIFLAFRAWSPSLYRSYMAAVQTAWVDVIATAFPTTDLIVSGQLPTDPTKPAIILCNHQIDADWWYLWDLARRLGGGGNLKICLKQELKYVPIFGWGLDLLEFLFVKRNVEHDRVHVNQHMARFVREKFPFWMLVFPEGTTIHAEVMEKSQRFAQRTNRPELTRLLLPRTTGLHTMLAATEQIKPDVYDLTMAYPTYSGEVPTAAMGYSRKKDTGVPSMTDVLCGRGPTTVWIHGAKHTFDDVFENEEAFLDNAWQAKEKLLSDFISNQEFAPAVKRRMLQSQRSWTNIVQLWASAAVALALSPVVACFAGAYHAASAAKHVAAWTSSCLVPSKPVDKTI